MVSCPYFTTNYLHVTKPLQKANDKDSFFIYMCVDGKAIIEANGIEETLMKGETLLLPAEIKVYNINAEDAKLLEVYV